jgi:hypothetical protein
LQQSYDAHKGQFELLAVAAPTTRDAEGFWKQNGYTFPMVMDIDGGAIHGVEGLPTTLFIDAKGNLVDTQVGAAGQAAFDAKLSALLK